MLPLFDMLDYAFRLLLGLQCIPPVQVDFGQRQLRVTTPSQFVHATSGMTTVQNWGSSYMREQLAIKRSSEQQKEAEQAATAAGASASACASGGDGGSGAGCPAELLQPESPEVFEANTKATEWT